MSHSLNKQKQLSTTIVFEYQYLLMSIAGVNNDNISILEYLFSLELFVHGNMITIRSLYKNRLINTENFIRTLIDNAKNKINITKEYINSLFNSMFSDRKEVDNDYDTVLKDNEKQVENSNKNIVVQKQKKVNNGDFVELTGTKEHKQHTTNFPIIDIAIAQKTSGGLSEKKKTIIPRTKNQALAIESFQKSHLTFLVGPAGTGKTFLTTAYALSQLMAKNTQRYIVTRPVVEAGEKLGYLPGDLYQKILPYMRPVFDELYSLSSESSVEVLQEKGQIEIAPLAYMRGRTLKNCIVLFDEAQNSTSMQMRMFLTRLGEGAKAIVTGDISQSDIQGRNGLSEAIQVFQNTKGVSIVQLKEEDIQRSRIAKIVINAYHQYDMKSNNTKKENT